MSAALRRIDAAIRAPRIAGAIMGADAVVSRGIPCPCAGDPLSFRGSTPACRSRSELFRFDRAAVPVTVSAKPERCVPPSRPARAEGSAAAAPGPEPAGAGRSIRRLKVAKAARRTT
ncbi:MAG TPA: hypothetical protein VJ724_04045, partial [Tahibacter sp.]|nr:hypothetical protein [Tahibacter sp.]